MAVRNGVDLMNKAKFKVFHSFRSTESCSDCEHMFDGFKHYSNANGSKYIRYQFDCEHPALDEGESFPVSSHHICDAFGKAEEEK